MSELKDILSRVERVLTEVNHRLNATQHAEWEAKRTAMLDSLTVLVDETGKRLNKVTLRLGQCRRDKDGWTAQFFPINLVGLSSGISFPVTADFAATAEIGTEYIFTFNPKAAA